MAFQADSIPGIDTMKDEAEQPSLLFTGPRGVAVRILSKAESSAFRIDKLIDLELRMSEWSQYDRALLIELVYGTLRWQARLDWVLTGFYHGEFTKCIVTVKNAMRVALYQILMLSKIPPSMAVNECASMIRRIKDDKSANIIAGVLKNILRNVEGIRYPNKDENIQLFYSVTLSHPLWIVKRWCERFGDEAAERILSTNNERPSITLGANRLRWTGSELTQWLKDHDCHCEPITAAEDLMRINGLQNVAAMEIINDGRAFVCSASDMQAAKLAKMTKGSNVLCLGATNSYLLLALCALSANEAHISSACSMEAYLPRLRSQLNILGFDKTVAVASAALEVQEKGYDIVVLEVPVSGLGTLNLFPELRWKLELDAVRKAVQLQHAKLIEAAELVRIGGALIYCAQSFEAEETTEVVDWFLALHPNFKHETAENECDPDYVVDGNVQCRLALHKNDNLFAARFVRVS